MCMLREYVGMWGWLERHWMRVFYGYNIRQSSIYIHTHTPSHVTFLLPLAQPILLAIDDPALQYSIFTLNHHR